MTNDDFLSLLDDISDCFIRANFELWRSRVSLPLSIITKQGPETLSDEAELRDNFLEYLKAAEIIGLDLVLRSPISLEDCQDGSFIATYRTDLLKDGQRQIDPYTSSALIVFEDGTWRIRSILNARGHHDWTGRYPQTKGNHNG